MVPPELIASDLQTPYGVAFDTDDRLFVSERKAGSIRRIGDDGKPHAFASTGGRPMGIAFDDSEDLFVAESGRHQVLLVSEEESALETSLEVFASQCHGRRLVGPRDLYFAPYGSLLFCDSGASSEAGAVYSADLDGEVTELGKSLADPCGLVLSMDALTLYVSESGKNRIVAFDLDDEGLIVDQRVFLELEGGDGVGPVLFDSLGQLYISRSGVGITIVDPDGQLVENIQLPGGQPRGMAFGGLNYDQLFVAEESAGGVYRLQLDQPGQRPFSGPRSI